MHLLLQFGYRKYAVQVTNKLEAIKCNVITNLRTEQLYSWHPLMTTEQITETIMVIY